MPILDIQRRGQQIGRIRIGHTVTASNGKKHPEKLAEFRFTTASRVEADAIADLYGGEVREWQRGQFEVYTRQSAIGVTVPPRDQVISQWYEMWNKGGCVRRCDSQHEHLSNGPCLCPHAENPGNEDEVAHAALRRAGMAKANPPQACKLVTRISVMIPDLPGLGVFRLDSGSYYAASEIGDAALLMQAARDKGVLLPAVLRIEQRQRVAGGKTTSYPVPVLEVLATFRQIATGALEAGGIAAQLPPPPGQAPKAITAAPVPAPEPPEPDVEPLDWERAKAIYERALTATTPADLTACAAEAKMSGLNDEHVCIDRANDEWQPLHDALTAIWQSRRNGGAADAT